MNVVDLEILIPASPEFIWRFLGDLSSIPQWQDGAESVAFLSTQREGKGARWRLTMARASDIVVEVSAWYDRLGYEYRIVDGAGYTENQGRIRSHEVADGTLVRWTFEYELGGVLGGLRNAMRLKRGISNQIQASLRNLHELVVQESGGISTHEAKATMREAPDVGERLAYQPRHPTAFQDISADETELVETSEQESAEEAPLEAAPALIETDTRPNPVVLANAPEEAEIEPLDAELDDTRPIEVEVFLPEAYTRKPEEPPVIDAPRAIPSPPPAPTEEEPAAMPTPQPVRETADESARLSVFEVFGLRRPSEIAADDSAPTPGISALRSDRTPVAERPARPPAIRVEAPADGASGSDEFTAIVGLRRTSRRQRPRLRRHTE